MADETNNIPDRQCPKCGHDQFVRGPGSTGYWNAQLIVPVLCAKCENPMGYGLAARLPRFAPPTGEARSSKYDPVGQRPTNEARQGPPPAELEEHAGRERKYVEQRWPARRRPRWWMAVLTRLGILLLLVASAAVVAFTAPFVLHLTHGARVMPALDMTMDDFRAIAECPGQIGDVWRLLNREDLTIEGDELVDRFCQGGFGSVQATSASGDNQGPNVLPDSSGDEGDPVLTPTPTFTPTLSQAPQPEDTILAALRSSMLGLINADRADHGVGPVALGDNAAAQWHAEDMLANSYISHWTTQGRKPYMLYTLAGGEGYMAENVAYSGFQDPSDDPDRYLDIDVREALARHEWGMMYDDAHADWGHRDNILNPDHQLVNLGIAFDEKRLAFVQHFESRRLAFTQRPQLSGTRFTANGVLDPGLGGLRAAAIYWDESPQAWSTQQLNNGPRSYSLGTGGAVVTVIPPAPPGSQYVNLPADRVIADLWQEADGRFSIVATVGLLSLQPGVYTVVLLAEEYESPLTSYSIFVE